MEVIRSSEAHLEDIVRLNEVVQKVHCEHEQSYFRTYDPDVVREHIQHAFADAAVIFLVALEEGVPLGYVLLRKRERPEDAFSKARTYLELEHIAVSPEARRRGVGSALIDETFVLAKALSIPDVELSVWQFNEDAKRLFSGKGFNVCWQRMKSRTP